MPCKLRKNGCTEHHDRHYCRVCGDRNASHFAKDCPHGILLYHGTPIDCLVSISKCGGSPLRPSTKGRLGAGVYLANYQEAVNVSKHRSNGKGICVVGVRVNLGKTKKVGSSGDATGSWQAHYDSAEAMHPPWAGMKYGFKEWCLKNPRKLRIVSVEVFNAKLDQSVIDAIKFKYGRVQFITH
mmetsp:Transcript_21659/g.34744  ORF Transcript_21659/g.34744 Transcript_21659/m.34744 type:complete len:183 (-) Transcript_21659:474-1022(-)